MLGCRSHCATHAPKQPFPPTYPLDHSAPRPIGGADPRPRHAPEKNCRIFGLMRGRLTLVGQAREGQTKIHNSAMALKAMSDLAPERLDELERSLEGDNGDAAGGEGQGRPSEAAE